MEVILREDIERLGNRGQVVKVADGYARNFLLPKRLAVAATDANRKIVEQRERSVIRVGDFEGCGRCAGPEELHHRPAESAVGRAPQAAWGVQGAGSAA